MRRNTEISGVVAGNRRRRVWRRVVSILACVVVFVTTYALILPAITLESGVYCGKPEHTHSAGCYTQVTSQSSRELICTPESLGIHQHTEGCYAEDDPETPICGYADFVVHKHGDGCFDASGVQVCPLEEIEAHTHDESCYAIPEHTHTEACYTRERGELICALVEGEAAHTHSAEAGCYTDARQLTCGLEESQGHEHNEDCYAADGTLTCGLEQSDGHTHTDECYTVSPELTCEISAEPHSHTDDCYAWSDVLTCGLEEGPIQGAEPELVCEKPEIELHEHDEDCYETDEDGNTYLICDKIVVLEHEHTDECFTAQAVPVDATVKTCGQEEHEAHSHSESCYDEEGNLICGKEETPGHRHMPQCYGTWELTCGLEEHAHTLACYSDPEADVETEEDWNAAAPELTGDWRQDLIAVAKSQLGYTASEKNYTVDEDGETIHGYTRYGAWYGDPYADWSNLFVLFCSHRAQVPARIQGPDCAAWIETLGEDYHLSGGDYVPQAGDLAFLDADGDGAADQAAVVTAVTWEPAVPTAEEAQTIEETPTAEEALTAEAAQAEEETAEETPAETLTGVELVLADGGVVVERVCAPQELLGYALLAAEPEDVRVTQVAEGEDYTVTAVYGPEARIPEDAVLSASEYPKESEEYQTRYAELAELYSWELDLTDRIRLFDIGFYVEGQEIEPAAEVNITITFHQQEKPTDYQIIHFGEEPEEVEAQSTYEDGAQNVDFTADSFSTYMLLARAVDALEGKTFVLVNAPYVMLANGTEYTGTSSGSNRLSEIESNFYKNSSGAYVWPKNGVDPNWKIWTFTRDDSDSLAQNQYYITTQESSSTQYLTFSSFFWDGDKQRGNADVTLKNKLQNVGTNGQYQIVTIEEDPANHSGQIRVYVEWNNHKYYLKRYGSGGFGGYTANSDDGTSYFYLADVKDPSKVEHFTGLTPRNTVINMFDYWRTERYPVGGDKAEADSFNDNRTTDTVGINNHGLKFVREGYGQSTGLVANKLVDGYPQLTSNNESLAYLFDPKNNAGGFKKSFTNVKGLLQQNAEGYYYYDCRQNYAELQEKNSDVDGWQATEDGDQIWLYEMGGVMAGGLSPDGQFFPFNNFQDSVYKKSTEAGINHWFGMTMTTEFMQRYGGHVSAEDSTPAHFDFSGDDDVWIFIDDVLVGDLGGIHAAQGITIDFETGNITITRDNGSQEYSNLKKEFQEADALNFTSWRDNTFADNTTHTLKFFYLERGNWDSNMSLTFRFSEIPASALRKTDQYGRAIPGATFGVYQCGDNWSVPDGETPVFTGTTNGNGELEFRDADGKAISIEEMEKQFGPKFVLRETSVPDGYRRVSNDIHFEIQGGAAATLVCDNSYESGVWATPTLKVTAPHNFQIIKNKTLVDQQYIQGDGTVNGTLFAVVLKYIGPDGDDKDMTKEANWVPVTGSAANGYRVVSTAGGFIPAVIQAASAADVFSHSDEGMTAHLTDIPGKVVDYYHFSGDNARYTVAYYWTEGSFAEANGSNTFRVNSEDAAHPFTREFGTNIEVPNLANRLLVQKYDENKNLVNGATFALFQAVEKPEDGDQSGDNDQTGDSGENTKEYGYLANDNTFVSLEGKTYVAKPPAGGLGENEYTFTADKWPTMDTDGTVTVSASNVSIRVNDSGTVKDITPCEVRTTNSAVLPGTDGTCVFGIWGENLLPGNYYLHEVNAPDGYELNKTPIMVRVTEDAIYANAGTVSDGVSVARGPGYLVSPLHKTASRGDINNTLTWIYQKLLVSQQTGFNFTLPPKDGTSDANWTVTGKESHLDYTSNSTPLGSDRYVANYEPRTSDDTQTLSTDVGWSYNAIYQDYDHGASLAAAKNAVYTDLMGYGDISNLFSRTVIVQVTDKTLGILEISKTVNAVEDAEVPESDENKDFTFYVTLKNEYNEPLSGPYNYTVFKIVKENGGETSRTELETRVLTLDATGKGSLTLKNNQAALIRNLPAKTYTVVEDDPGENYTVTAVQKDPGALTETQIDGGTVSGSLVWQGEGDPPTVVDKAKVDFTNTYDPAPKAVNLVIHKVRSGNEDATLAGAEFTLTRTVDDQNEYYAQKADSTGEWEWVKYTGDAKPVAYATGTDGKLTFAGIGDGSYKLTETKAPNGYIMLKEPITITITKGVISVPDLSQCKLSQDGVTLIIPNDTGTELPESGGMGTTVYTAVGLLMMVSAACLMYCKRRKGKEDFASS